MNVPTHVILKNKTSPVPLRRPSTIRTGMQPMRTFLPPQSCFPSRQSSLLNKALLYPLKKQLKDTAEQTTKQGLRLDAKNTNDVTNPAPIPRFITIKTTSTKYIKTTDDSSVSIPKNTIKKTSRHPGCKRQRRPHQERKPRNDKSVVVVTKQKDPSAITSAAPSSSSEALLSSSSFSCNVPPGFGNPQDVATSRASDNNKKTPRKSVNSSLKATSPVFEPKKKLDLKKTASSSTPSAPQCFLCLLDEDSSQTQEQQSKDLLFQVSFGDNSTFTKNTKVKSSEIIDFLSFLVECDKTYVFHVKLQSSGATSVVSSQDICENLRLMLKWGTAPVSIPTAYRRRKPWQREWRFKDNHLMLY